MFRLRIHSVDTPRAAAAAPEPAAAEGGSSGSHRHHLNPSSSTFPLTTAAAAANPNPKIQINRGIVHLFRNVSSQPVSSSSTSSSHDQSPVLLPPAGRGTLLFVLAIPSRLSPEDFLHFCCWSYAESFSEIRVVRNDAIEERYSMLIQFDDQKTADSFYFDLNGWRFPSEEAEVCHILFTTTVEYTESTEIAGTPPAGCTELPTCPVCLERLDQDTSGVITTGCDHSFQCSCISKWANSSCPVCRFCLEHSEKPTCSVCETSENLWICMICGFVGCGRYKEGHAIRHWKDTQHCYSLDLQTQRVWDYVGDTYVHRLNQSKSNGKLVKLKSQSRSIDDDFGSFEYSEDSGINGALFSSKVELIVDEYNHLLASQLENQRQYYESLLVEAKVKREKSISEAVERAVTVKLQNIQLNLQKVVEEKKIVADLNENLMKNQSICREKIKEIEERERTTLRLKDEKIRDLEEEIRDVTVYVEAQKALDNIADADDIRGGTVLPVPLQQASSPGSTRRSSKMSRRRR